MALEDEMTMDEVVAPEVDEATLDEQVASFDLAKWVEGLTPMRGAVTIYANPKINAEVAVIDSRINEARQTGAKPELLLGLNEERRNAMRRMIEYALDVVFEARSQDWVNREIQAGKRAGLEGVALESAVMVKQIVEPAGITTDLLEKIEAINGGQYARLKDCWKRTNEEAGVSVPF